MGRVDHYAERRGDRVRRFYFYVPKGRSRQIRGEIKAKKLSVSKYVVKAVQRETHPGWPEGYFERVVGKWQGDFPDTEELLYEARNSLFGDT